IGDDGLEGIQCAQGDPTGEAHLSLQQLALDLRNRGIVLAVSSKNNDDVARLPFRNHPDMLLREQHIAVFQANWSDKPTNIKAFADELSLGLESLVLVDDNPAERGLVRQVLPEVAVPELPSDPALFARTLTAAGYFESAIFSEEDLNRAGFYQDNARRVNLQKQVGDVDQYLASLNMQITFQPFDATGRPRIAQLVNKSNQFNLTTRRYTEAQIAEIERDANCFTLQVRLSDIFGDNGMISVVICRRTSNSTWEIDTWLMSCRVLGRGVERMVLRQLIEHAQKHGIRKLIGCYRPTERNKLVEDHYPKLGFQQVERMADGTTLWELDVNTAKVDSAPMTVRALGFDLVEA
ncbi:MAG: haloacid dehalogenase, partial [Acidobacteriaceae bacterium]|nr:haloacid dehalogenase [Acidobacteriaceae bacterium]